MRQMPLRACSLVTAFVVAMAVLLCSPPAGAEKADRDKPVNIEADRMNYDDLRRINVFEGGVTLTQGTLVIRADKLTVREDAEGFQRGIAEKGPGGFAYFRQRREGLDEFIEGWGERIDYDARTEKAELTTRARILRGADEVRGDRISYDGRTEFYNVVGARDGAASGNSDGRVRAVITPKNIAPGAGEGGARRPALDLKPSGAMTVPSPEYPAGPKK